MVEIPCYRRKARQKDLYDRRCLHWAHIKKYKGVNAKIRYIVKRLLGIKSPSDVFHNFCIHRGDGKPWLPASVEPNYGYRSEFTYYRPGGTS